MEKLPSRYGIVEIKSKDWVWTAKLIVDGEEYKIINGKKFILNNNEVCDSKNIDSILLIESDSPKFEFSYYLLYSIILDKMVEGTLFSEQLLIDYARKVYEVFCEVDKVLSWGKKPIILTNDNDSILITVSDNHKYLESLTYESKVCNVFHDKLNDKKFDMKHCIYLFKFYFAITVNIIMNNDEIDLRGDMVTKVHQLLYENMPRMNKACVVR